ncbi:MAG: BACON domain-containing protein [Muribaculum sp.]|nr:BACON domain-containing protein [Muribaculum sp.]
MNFKNKFSYIALSAVLLCGFPALTSCDNEKDAPPYIDATENEIVLEDNGFTVEGIPASFQLGANDGWKVAYAPEWIHVNYESGDRGRVTIHISAEENFTGQDRYGVIEFQLNGGKPEQVGVTQKMKTIEMEISKEFIVASAGGLDENDEMPTFTIESNHPWNISMSEGCDWITANPSSGPAGKTEVSLTLSRNESTNPRHAKVLVIVGKTEFPINVDQLGKINPDSKPVGHVYFSETFDWAHEAALLNPDKCQDQVGSVNGSKGNTLPIYSNGNELLRSAFESTLIDLNPGGSCIYVADGYIKMGKGKNQTGVELLNPLDIEEGCVANIEVSFSFAKNGTDNVTVSVEIEGDGQIIGGETPYLSSPLEPINNSDKTINWQWKDGSVVINGATASTRIKIRSTQFGLSSGYYRWFLDNIKVTRLDTSN